MLVYPGVSSVDASGPLEPFGLANFLTGRQLYKPVTVSVDGAPVSVAGGFLNIVPSCACEDLPARIDLMLVAGGPGCFAAAEDETLLSWLRRLEPRCARLGSVCTGSTILVASGIADGHRVATHWLEAIRLKQCQSAVEIEEDAIFVNSGKLWTSAGMLAGIDLTLALIEKDHGRQLALDIARFMVLVLRRISGQTQFSPQLMAEATEDPRIRRVQLFVWENPTADLSVANLAKKAAMSERSLVRLFKKVTNTTLSQYIEDVRLTSARQLLETSQQSVQSVAVNAGFGTAATLRRVFTRRLGVCPSSYRQSFGTDHGAAPPELAVADVVAMDLAGVINGKSAW
ncbi:GlxA family transcriptional regulator [Roseovarius nubinhibens]|uniref:AraC family transcriptional regulator n=1 Tax=Roseovarius nubinhibens TaxID=314263 RepID=A0A348WGB9_9RHOB|nr:AraC family transcriptional regulator [Roseovarius nubinhibens]